MKLDRGSAPLELALGVGLLVVPIVVLFTVAPPLLEYRAVARLGAAEAARVIVTGDGTSASHMEARSAAFDAMEGSAGVVDLCGGFCSLGRGDVVAVTVAIEVPAIDIPLVGSIGTFVVSATHREQVDAYRSLP